MVNFKLPYLLYPAVIGVALGYLVSTIASSVFTAPKPLPIPRVKKVEKEQIDYNKTASDIISKNIFMLDMTPQAQANSSTGGAGGTAVSSPDGAPLNPAPPFNAIKFPTISSRLVLSSSSCCAVFANSMRNLFISSIVTSFLSNAIE